MPTEVQIRQVNGYWVYTAIFSTGVTAGRSQFPTEEAIRATIKQLYGDVKVTAQ